MVFSGPTAHSQCNMNIQYWWNDSEQRRPKRSQHNMSQCHSVNHKSHKDSCRNEAGPPPGQPVKNRDTAQKRHDKHKYTS